MKKLRIINACIWAAITIGMATMVAVNWSEIDNLWLYIVITICACVFGWWLFDMSMVEANS